MGLQLMAIVCRRRRERVYLVTDMPTQEAAASAAQIRRWTRPMTELSDAGARCFGVAARTGLTT